MSNRVELSKEDGAEWSIVINGEQVAGMTVGLELEAGVNTLPRLTLFLVPEELRVKLNGVELKLAENTKYVV